jgi:hypothetical protein
MPNHISKWQRLIGRVRQDRLESLSAEMKNRGEKCRRQKSVQGMRRGESESAGIPDPALLLGGQSA